MKSKVKVVLIIAVSFFVGVSCFVICQFVKTNTNMILWNYTITRDAFDKASAELLANEKSDKEILKELSNSAFEPVWQIRDLSKPLLISNKWYPSNFRNYLFECVGAEDLTNKEAAILIKKIGDLTTELDKINWNGLRLNGKYFDGKKKDIYEVINELEIISGE